MNKLALSLAVFLLIPITMAHAQSQPNLYVSAENSVHNNHFAGSMVVEVIVNDPSISDTGDGKGEPDVTINGKTLRMVQATDGRWYAYFANVDRAKAADQIAFDSGVPGTGLDFGVFCSKDTTSLGASFTESDGIAVPRSITGATNGNSGFNTCTGAPSGTNINNVVRYPRTINTNPAIPSGQIGLDDDAWPIIQLFSFSSDVVIQYNGAGSTQQVTLQYDDIPNISLSLDRSNYPPNSEVFATIRDMQLNQDPTARDSWTFNVVSPQAVFYAAFTEGGSNAANGGAGLVNLVSKLSNIGFEKNGKVAMSLGSVVQLRSNGFQSSTATDGTTTYQKIVTFVETEPNSAVFETADFSDRSNIGILSTAPRGQSGSIEYNSNSVSIVSGLGNADISLGSSQILPGNKIPVRVTDPDQNVNGGARDRLEMFRSSALIPSLTIGSPATLEDAGSVKIYALSGDALAGGNSVTSSVPDTNADRLVLDTRSSTGIANQSFEKMSLNLGLSAAQLQSILIDTAVSGNSGTNWINYDLRSLEKQLGITDYSDTSISLYFGLADPTPVTLVSAGSMTGPQGFLQIGSSAVTQISSESGSAFLVINFDASSNSAAQGTISTETDTQPIIVDMFSFGQKGTTDVNNAVYRFELRETTPSSGIFAGTMEYTIANQLNQFDASLIRTLRPINEDVKFFVNQRLIDEKGINIHYSDLDQTGVTTGTSSKSDILTHSGSVSLNSKTFRFGSPVTVILVDSDLNVNHDEIDIYSVIDNPSSADVDTVGGSGGMLLEVLIKDVRFKRCTINGVEYGGLAATGFALIETGPNTGRFEGTFKMPSQICNRDGTKLMSPAGGIVDLKYHDFRDSSGQQNIFGLSKTPTKDVTAKTPTKEAKPQIKSKTYDLPAYGKTTEIPITGKVPNYKSGTKVQFTLTKPDGKTINLDVTATKTGLYKVLVTLKHNSPTGPYSIDIKYLKSQVGKVSFNVVDSKALAKK